jgi:tripartite-type tricarboxylate transporter receptor subunit TctC
MRANHPSDNNDRRWVRTATVLLAVAVALPASARADDFYKGKTINLYIGSGPGGGYDQFGRLVARHLGNFVAGQPVVVPHNMPGAGSLAAANFVYNNAPRDGTVLEIGTPSIALIEALRYPGVRFESAKFNWIGRVASLTNVTFTAKTAKVKTIEDATKTEALIASIADASPLALYPRVMNNIIGTKFKIITGYADSNDTLLAVERGEVDGSTVSWATLNATRPSWLRDKSINVLVQYDLNRHPQLPDVPTEVELGRSGDERQLLTLFATAAEVGYSIAATPDAPADRIQMLRDGFDAMVKSREFRDDIAAIGGEFDPMPGAKLQNLIRDSLNISPQLRDRAIAVAAGK